MVHFVGLDVSVKETSVCVVDDAGQVILEQKVPTEPADIIALLTSLSVTYEAACADLEEKQEPRVASLAGPQEGDGMR
jgi:predicted NBD/HSP70 family sugar kinase